MKIQLLPKIKKCPNCSAVNILRVNGISYNNNFKSLADWTLKKKLNCRKCKIQLGLFVNNFHNEEKLVWIDYLNCEELYLTKLNKLEKYKFKYKEKKKKNEYLKIIKEIETIQNQIRSEQVKVKIKVKIQNKGMLI